MTDERSSLPEEARPSDTDFEISVGRRRRREVPACVALGVLAAGLIAAGTTARILGAVVFGGWIAGLVVLALRGRRLRARGESGQGPRGRIEAAALDGIPATVLREHPAFAVHSAVGLAYVGSLFLLPLLAWDDLEVAQRVAPALLGTPLFLAACRRVRWARRAGVWLTENEVVVQGWGQTRWVRWSDVGLIAPGTSAILPLVHLMSRHESGVQVRGRSRLLPGMEAPGYIAVPTSFSALDAGLTAQVLVHLVRSTETSILSTRAGPDLVRAIVAR